MVETYRVRLSGYQHGSEDGVDFDRGTTYRVVEFSGSDWEVSRVCREVLDEFSRMGVDLPNVVRYECMHVDEDSVAVQERDGANICTSGVKFVIVSEGHVADSGRLFDELGLLDCLWDMLA